MKDMQWRQLPPDPIKQRGFIRKFAKKSTSTVVKHILDNYQPTQDVTFRVNDPRTLLDMGNVTRKIATLVQLHGEVRDPCATCRKGLGIFAACVRIPGEQENKCGNCILMKKPCCHGDASQHPRGLLSGFKRGNRRKADSTSLPATQTGFLPDYNDMQNSTLVIPAVKKTQRVLASDDSYVVLGNLIMPPPPKDKSTAANKWQNELRLLDNRNMADLEPSIRDLDKAFRDFRAQEPSTWGPDVQRHSKHLVRPSGSLQSPLSHRLNQPSWTSGLLEDGETADPTNGCIAMVMGNGWTPETLIYDHIHRRDEDSNGIDEYPPEVLQVHENFTYRIEESSWTKVEIVYGKKVQARFLRQHPDCAVLPLWADYEGLALFLVPEKDFSNCDERYKIRRVVLMACHPQHIFFNKSDSKVAFLQERIIQAAAEMVQGQVPCVENYFREQKWRAQILSVSQQMELRAFGRLIARTKQVPQPTILDDFCNTADQSAAGLWYAFFNAYPHSNDDLRALIQPAKDALKETNGSSNGWELPTDMPLQLLDWFKGLFHVVFHGRIDSFGDVIRALEGLLQVHVPAQCTRPLEWILAETLDLQQRVLEKLEDDGEEHQNLWHTRFDGGSIALRCKICQSEAVNPDTNTRWSTKRPGHYIARTRRCRAATCKKPQPTRPVDENLDYTSCGPIKLSQPQIVYQRKFDYKTYTHASGGVMDQLPPSVACWCIYCKKLGDVKGGGPIWIDKNPRWTIGSTFYVEFKKKCANCAKGPNKRHGEIRLVPVDDRPSIPGDKLTKFHNANQHLSRSMQLELLKMLPPSSRDPRQLK